MNTNSARVRRRMLQFGWFFTLAAAIALVAAAVVGSPKLWMLVISLAGAAVLSVAMLPEIELVEVSYEGPRLLIDGAGDLYDFLLGDLRRTPAHRVAGPWRVSR